MVSHDDAIAFWKRAADDAETNSLAFVAWGIHAGLRMTKTERLLAQDALCDAAQFIDTVRQDAIREGWWTDWDQAMREKITTALKALDYGQRG